MYSIIQNILRFPLAYKTFQGTVEESKILQAISRDQLEKSGNILDIGCGPGTSYPYFKGKNYLGIDLEKSYIDYANKKYGPYFKVEDANELAKLEGNKFDFILINSLLHHLSDSECESVFKSCQSLLSENGRIHILELVIPPKEFITARFLCKHDRGKFPRSEDSWKKIVSSHFRIDDTHTYYLSMIKIPLWKMIYLNCSKN